MSSTVVFGEKLTNFYRYPSICGFQDRIADPNAFLGRLDSPRQSNRDAMIYIHIPFCRSLCTYCPFYKVHSRHLDYEAKKHFIDCLTLELERYSQQPFFRNVPIVNVNMGGGTPMVLEIEFLEKILSTIHRCFNMERCEVVSVEGDPITLQDVDKLKALKGMGLTRVSFGIQSFNEVLRKKLGVQSSVLDIYKAVKSIEKSGITEWGCDMLYNCPDQNVNEIRFNVDRICDLQPSVVDIYDLNISPNTALARMLDTNMFRTKPSNKNEIEMFKAATETFVERDYVQVRSVNFEPKNYQHSTKSILYAFSADLLAIGPSARTFLYSAGMNYRNHCSIEKYVESIENGAFPVEAGNYVPGEVLEDRDIILFPYYLKIAKNRINYERFKSRIKVMVDSGYINETDQYLELTELGKQWAGNVQYFFFSDIEKQKAAQSMFQCLQEKKNLFNQDYTNCNEPDLQLEDIPATC